MVASGDQPSTRPRRVSRPASPGAWLIRKRNAPPSSGESCCANSGGGDRRDINSGRSKRRRRVSSSLDGTPKAALGFEAGNVGSGFGTETSAFGFEVGEVQPCFGCGSSTSFIGEKPPSWVRIIAAEAAAAAARRFPMDGGAASELAGRFGVVTPGAKPADGFNDVTLVQPLSHEGGTIRAPLRSLHGEGGISAPLFGSSGEQKNMNEAPGAFSDERKKALTLRPVATPIASRTPKQTPAGLWSRQGPAILASKEHIGRPRKGLGRRAENVDRSVLTNRPLLSGQLSGDGAERVESTPAPATFPSAQAEPFAMAPEKCAPAGLFHTGSRKCSNRRPKPPLRRRGSKALQEEAGRNDPFGLLGSPPPLQESPLGPRCREHSPAAIGSGIFQLGLGQFSPSSAGRPGPSANGRKSICIIEAQLADTPGDNSSARSLDFDGFFEDPQKRWTSPALAGCLSVDTDLEAISFAMTDMRLAVPSPEPPRS